MASQANRIDLLVVGIVGVVVCTHVFTNAARGLGWKPIAITASLYLAGRAADQW